MIADHIGLDVGRLKKETSFIDDLGIDSLTLINFIVKLEKKYNVKVEMDNIVKLKTVGEAYDVFVNTIKELK